MCAFQREVRVADMVKARVVPVRRVVAALALLPAAAVVRVILGMANTSVAASGDSLTINWSVTFKPTVSGDKNVYLKVRDDLGLGGSPQQLATWTVNGPGIPASVTAAGGARPLPEPFNHVGPAEDELELPMLQPEPEAGMAEVALRMVPEPLEE